MNLFILSYLVNSLCIKHHDRKRRRIMLRLLEDPALRHSKQTSQQKSRSLVRLCRAEKSGFRGNITIITKCLCFENIFRCQMENSMRRKRKNNVRYHRHDQNIWIVNWSKLIFECAKILARAAWICIKFAI
jgi:hypothetical protein